MNKLLVALLAVPSIALADAKDIRDMLNTFAPQPQVVFVQPNNFAPNPPAYLPPVRGRMLEPVDFGGARLNETPSFDLYGDSNGE